MRWFVPMLVLGYNSRRETGEEFSCRDENPLWHAWREALRAMLLLASEKDLSQTYDGRLHVWMNEFANKYVIPKLDMVLLLQLKLAMDLNQPLQDMELHNLNVVKNAKTYPDNSAETFLGNNVIMCR